MKIKTLPLALSDVDRADYLRSDEAELALLWNRGKILCFDGERFRTYFAQGSASLYLHEASEIPVTAIKERYFLGITHPHSSESESFFLAVIKDLENRDSFSDGEQWRTLREIGADLSPREIGLAVHSQGLAHWHARHPRCPLCGELTEPTLGGSVRKCSADGSEHYPRTDPAIIVLLRDSDDRILLGRQRVWPEFRFSTFAGFVETGESFEQCVKREVREEAGVNVSDIEYLGSQPWPFPASLMVAFQARIDNPESARPDGAEIEEVRWFTRDELIEATLDGTLLLPPLISVARAMIEAWYHEGESDVDSTNKRTPLPGSDSWRNS